MCTNPVQLSDVGKGFPYSLPSVGPGADPGVQAVCPLVIACGSVTFPAAEHHRPWPVPSYTAW